MLPATPQHTPAPPTPAPPTPPLECLVSRRAASSAPLRPRAAQAGVDGCGPARRQRRGAEPQAPPPDAPLRGSSPAPHPVLSPECSAAPSGHWRLISCSRATFCGWRGGERGCRGRRGEGWRGVQLAGSASRAKRARLTPAADDPTPHDSKLSYGAPSAPRPEGCPQSAPAAPRWWAGPSLQEGWRGWRVGRVHGGSGRRWRRSSARACSQPRRSRPLPSRGPSPSPAQNSQQGALAHPTSRPSPPGVPPRRQPPPRAACPPPPGRRAPPPPPLPRTMPRSCPLVQREGCMSDQC